MSNQCRIDAKSLGQKSRRAKVPQMFRISVPNFAPNFAPRIFRTVFVLRFVGTETRKKIHQKSPAFFNAKFPGNFEEKIHKSFLESGQSNKSKTPEEGRARRIRGWGPGVLCLINPSQP